MLALQDPLSLGGWFADPLTPAEAQSCEDEIRKIRKLIQLGVMDVELCPQCELKEMAAGFWQGDTIDMEYGNLCQTTTDRRAQALLELMYGQLLMSVKRSPAMTHLQKGFILATPFFDAHDYFRVMKRHELLQWLPLHQQPMPAQSLHGLLQEAAVVRELRLRNESPELARPDHYDTLG